MSTALILRDKARELIALAEENLAKLPQLNIPIRNYFSKGVYAREMSMPKGAIVIGKIHKHTNMNIISKGKVKVASIDGSFVYEAPATFVASPGVKRVIYALEETVWTTIHGTHETDLAKIESEFIAKDYSEVKE